MPQREIWRDMAGECVRDCHAEVLARRAFIRFLYLQLQSARAKRHVCCLEGCSSAAFTCSAGGADQPVSSTTGCSAQTSLQARPQPHIQSIVLMQQLCDMHAVLLHIAAVSATSIAATLLVQGRAAVI
ncbi:MAG: hypothetical protein HC767_08705 [Akkermansiaceae bacterium]|nr:hypothetical protein [Akkermansiaceae bacterium]